MAIPTPFSEHAFAAHGLKARNDIFDCSGKQVAEVRQAREAYAKQFNYDVYAMGRDLQERQQKSGRPVVALVSGSNRLDEERLGSVAGNPVAKANAEMARSSTGYSIGGVPPFGHLTEIPVFMDRDLLGYDVVWAAAGRPDSVFEIEPERLRELSSATVIDLREEVAGG